MLEIKNQHFTWVGPWCVDRVEIFQWLIEEKSFLKVWYADAWWYDLQNAKVIKYNSVLGVIRICVRWHFSSLYVVDKKFHETLLEANSNSHNLSYQCSYLPFNM